MPNEFDEREFISRLESANTTGLAAMLKKHTAEEERALRTYFGDERYRRLRDLALKQSVTRSASPNQKGKGNVVVIHGIMGSELSAKLSDGSLDQIWAKILRLISGKMELLRLKEDGRTPYTSLSVSATGIMKKYYGEMLLSLAGEWDVRGFWFDWRKDLNLAADELKAHICRWVGDKEPVHIVAHSMGGLVARTFIQRYPDRWKAMWDEEGGGRRGGRLIMLGTPNHGSFAPVQVLTGLESMVVKLALIDPHHTLPELLEVLTSFAGLYQMLPSPLLQETAHLEQLYKSQTYDALKIASHRFFPFKSYNSLNVSQSHLEAALAHHREISGVADSKRMLYIAGYNQPTYYDVVRNGHGLPQWSKLASKDGYRVTVEGDGRVPHIFGRLLDPKRGEEVPMYYIEEEHGRLSNNNKILTALDGLLENGDTDMFERKMPAARRGEAGADEAGFAYFMSEQDEAETLRVIDLLPRVRTRGADPNVKINVDERELEENIMQGILVARPRRGETLPPLPPARIEIALVHGKIEEAHDRARARGVPAVDALAVGHYFGVRPQYAELKLDRAISAALLGLKDPGELREDDHLLTMYSERGILRGDLGQPFFIDDPRADSRVIAIAGMGLPGHFGAPELTVLARELCWSLGRLGKRHLATIVIGSGQGNLPVSEAMTAWIRGIKHAVTGAFEQPKQRLQRVTFVEYNESRLREIQEAILGEKERLANRLTIEYKPLSDEEITRLEDERWENELIAVREALNKGPQERRGQDAEDERRIATRVTLISAKGGYSFSAITDTASIPVREIPVDPSLVQEANDEIAGESVAQMQLQRGQFLEQLIIPRELRSQLASNSPLVILLDRTTARIHWEMAAQSNVTFEDVPVSPTGRPVGGNGRVDEDFPYETTFLGTSRGLTRQLITNFAPPPEPPPPPRRVMRVLVVADPAADMPLKGAEEEGVEVADLFESFNRVYEHTSRLNRIEVVRLFGPQEAKRTNVLRHLMSRYYDVFHFAGHCAYDSENPTNSGWIFTGGARLTANELNRIDRIPKFVFSNACESGVTPDESERRSDELAPSFAESFFARGVSNFVCTAWPVEDVAARIFALRLYSGLLGVRYSGIERFGAGGAGAGGGHATKYSARRHEQMYEAMQEARLALARDTGGRRTWGAYQHYGNPFLRFFNPASFKTESVESNGGGNGHRRATTVVLTGKAAKAEAASGNGANGNSRARAAKKSARAKQAKKVKA